MLKLWLVKFSNGEEWHVFGEQDDVWWSCVQYLMPKPPHDVDFEITFLRAYRSK